MPKFFFDLHSLEGARIEIDGETAHHIVNVLRHRVGDRVLLCDGKRMDYVTELISYETGRKSTKAWFEVQETKKSPAEPRVYVRLHQSVINWENFEIAIQKSVEVGVSEIVPMITERTVHKLHDVKKKLDRFGRIAKSAAEQSMRGIVPTVQEPAYLLDTIKNKEAVGYFACCSKKEILECRHEDLMHKKIDLWVGPEGGFTDSEKKSMLAQNIVPVGLGPRVLRSETASIVLISHIVMSHERWFFG